MRVAAVDCEVQQTKTSSGVRELYMPWQNQVRKRCHPQSSQYHHFIPRFLLRNFAAFKNPGKIVPKVSRRTKNRAPKPQKLTMLDLESGNLKEGDVGDTFGIVDMYRDFK